MKIALIITCALFLALPQSKAFNFHAIFKRQSTVESTASEQPDPAANESEWETVNEESDQLADISNVRLFDRRVREVAPDSCRVKTRPQGDENVCGSWPLITVFQNCWTMPKDKGPDTGSGEVEHPSNDEIREILDMHNKYRAKVGAVAMHRLKWDDRLFPIAQAVASTCRLKHSEGLHADPPYPDVKCPKCTNTAYHQLGENLAGPGFNLSYKDAINMWVKSEKACFTPGRTMRECTGMCGHYTQIVWANTKAVACARAHCGSRGVMVACNYGEAGNFPQPPYEKGEPGSACGRGEFGPKGPDNLCVSENTLYG